MRAGVIVPILFALFVLWHVLKSYRRRAAAGADGPADLDTQTVEHLRQAGSDLSKPHDLEFFLYLPSSRAAQEVASLIRGMGYEARVEPAKGADSKWLCLATRSMIPKTAALRSIRTSFTRLAASNGGEYDGWGAPTVR
jgi:hypothetical protein